MAKDQSFAGNAFGAVGMMLPLVYFGGLIAYFSQVGGGLQGIIDIGLGPTVLGLTALGLLFSIKPLMLLLRLVAGTVTGTAGSSGKTAAGASDADEARGDFDADDVLARYMAKRSAAPAPPADAQVSAQPVAPAPPPRPGFGRKAV